MLRTPNGMLCNIFWQCTACNAKDNQPTARCHIPLVIPVYLFETVVFRSLTKVFITEVFLDYWFCGDRHQKCLICKYALQLELIKFCLLQLVSTVNNKLSYLAPKTFLLHLPKFISNRCIIRSP